MSVVRDRYPIRIKVLHPDSEALGTFVGRNGPNAFYDSIAQRKECCHIRKVEPLRKALAGKKAWLTGLRREQSATREGLEIESWDDQGDCQGGYPRCKV